MSISKINNQIEELEKKSQEINSTITDPIERNEYKRQLQKQIKKLTQTKNNLEKLQLEQEELESLKAEIIVNQTSNISDQKQPEAKPNNQNNVSYQSVDINDLSVTKNFEELLEAKPENLEPLNTDNIYSPVTKNNDSKIVVPDNFQTSKKPQKSPLIYLSKRAIWLSTIFAFIGFYLPYIYTRRWKPFFILLLMMWLATIYATEENILKTLPWISAIDNGVAIAKSKNKLKHKTF